MILDSSCFPGAHDWHGVVGGGDDRRARGQSQLSMEMGGEPGHVGKRQWLGKHFRENVTLD